MLCSLSSLTTQVYLQKRRSRMSTAVQALTGTWQADRVHSSLGFEVKHMGVSTFRAQVGEFEATLTVDGADDARLAGRGRVDSIKTSEPSLDAHLQAPDFFDAERNPELTFVSRSVTLD